MSRLPIRKKLGAPRGTRRIWINCRFVGELLMAQRRATVPFTFNLVMTTPIRLQEPLTGAIDLLGPLW